MMELTERQREVLRFIESKIDQGIPPTQAEIQDHFGFESRNASTRHLEVLEGKGYISRERGKSRSIRVLIHTNETV